MALKTITHWDSPEMAALSDALRSQADALDQAGDDAWPDDQLFRCAEAGVFSWFLEPQWGGQAWSPHDIMAGYLELSAACLTTTFIITQRMGACRRIAGSDNLELARRLLPDLVAGKTFATVGISHLTTSRRHLAAPVLGARETDAGFVLNGYSPWCTGGNHADYVVLGAAMEDGRELLVAAPMSLPGISASQPSSLLALTASQTGAVVCDEVEVPREFLLAGPVANVMQQGTGAATGGVQTSVLAAGLARAASRYLADEASRREDLEKPAQTFHRETQQLCDDLLAAAAGATLDATRLRQRANSLVTRVAQAALAAAKGAGYVTGHPVGRWCRESLFFLVWSCPQPVLEANLCELSGLESFD